MIDELDNAPSEQMEYARINSPNFLVNSGLMIVLGIIVAIVYAVGSSIPATSRNNSCVYTTNFFFKGFYVIAFLPMLVSTFVQFKYTDVDDGISILGLIMSLIYLGFLILSLVYIVVMTIRSR
mmetsp:Transcript_9081/g.1342  ORF Transcript_9081/g.1342 Transcript_9081/m.1342 type:complete len:123 (+) Transcript_9081:16440-16808(+)